MKDQFVVYLIALGCFCMSSTQSVGQVKAAFSANTVEGCSPLVVQFQDASTGNPASWRWDLGNGTISLFQNPSTVYFAPGTYAVKLVVKNAGGADSVVRQQYITVNDNPEVNFSASDSIGCFPFPVTFTDKSSVSNSVINSWQWDFGDGNTSTAQHPSHTYTGTGNYTVTLKATTDKGCSKGFSKSQYIQITSGALANFDYTPVQNSCNAPLDIDFNNKSVESGTVSYLWNFGDGQTSTDKSPRHRYVANGAFTVTLIAITSSGCRDTLRKTNLIVLGNTLTQFTIPGSVCAGQSFFPINTSTPVPGSVRWDFGDGSQSTAASPQKSYATAATYTIKLVNHFAACPDSVSKTITVLPRPSASFTTDRTYSCSVPAAIQFTNTTIGVVGYHWDFGDGNTSTDANPKHVYSAFGNYTVKLIVTGSNGCTDTIIKQDLIRVNRPQVQINNLPLKGCLPFTVPFSARITVQDNVVTYRWDFGDGTGSTQAAPTKTYTTEGSYTVKLVITTAGGCTDSMVIPYGVEAAPPPVAEFTANPREVCRSQAIQFTNQSAPAGEQWVWIFGDGGLSGRENPVYQYSDTGYFSVTLIATNKGCSDTITKNNFVKINPPVARFTPMMTCADKYARTFVDNSIAAQSWLWDFGDGTTSISQSPSHRYAARGSYRVRLIVTNGGCVDSMMRYIIIADEHPDFDADKKDVCKEEEIAFTIQKYDPAYISSILWYFGDDSLSVVPGNVTHSYKRSGWYDVTLVYTDVNGCIGSTLKRQYIRVNGPAAAFEAVQQKICIDKLATFRDLSVADGMHPIVKWVWVYGDGKEDTLTAPPFTHQYDNGGSYTVSLRVTDSRGCTDNYSRAAAISISNPRAAFSTVDTSSCPGKPVNFSNGSTGENLQYKWEFGDGNTATQVAPVHHYQYDGLYTVNLFISDPIGCRDTVKRTDYIKIVTPVAGFTMSDSIGSCPPLQVKFTSEAKNYVTIRWEFGDGSTSTLEHPEHYYNIPGEFTVTQTVIAPGGCIATMSRKVIVKGPKGDFTYTPTTGCVPLTVQFNGVGNDIKSYIWDYNDGNTTASTVNSVQYTYNAAGRFIPRMILIDSNGCQVPVIGKDTINAIGVVARATMDTYRICNSGYIQFTDKSVANDYITAHLWDFGDGTYSMQPNPRHHFSTAPANYTVLHMVTTANGCKDVLRMIDTIKVFATPKVAITGDKEACEPGQLNFNAVVTGDDAGLKKHWEFGNGQTAETTTSVSHTYNAPGNYQVQLQTVYQDYCFDTARHSVTIWPLPNTFAGKDTFVCRGTPMQLKPSGALQYTWASTPDISCTNCTAPLINPANNTTYIVTGVSAKGCVKSDTINVRVRQPFTMQVQPGDTICAGEQIRLSASGADQYQWSPATGLDNNRAASPKASPAKTTIYTVVGNDNDHCFTDTGVVNVVVYPIPQIFAGNDTTVNTGNTIHLKPTYSQDVSSFNWTPANGLSCTNCPSPKAQVKGSVTYRVTASNQGGCTASDDITITSICNGDNYFIPNTFSPNGDGVNDVFMVRGKGVYNVHSLRIFNRWGHLVFEKRNFMANDPAAGWDGKINGRLADMDVYVYIVDIICDNSNIIPYKGNVALIR
ncbi:PKD domain-containing protein [Niastella caeni]|uniref:PKD domain-containing protein n=1 Tax=Niastella caeni TaxID=2569763 RepID=A0A4V4H1C1_9BACT|nr:PKD domain-containing protein [Niastella caeni]THU39976.1 PKD domain-containing protein [Niastella caeni]